MKHEFLDLGTQPLANGFLLNKNQAYNELKYSLKVCFDDENYLVSLKQFVPPKMMFNENYPYYPSQSHTMLAHFFNAATIIKDKKLYECIHSKNKILEIGSSDGVFLRNFKTWEIMGVEPCKNFVEITRKMGYEIYHGFWNKKASQTLKHYCEKDGFDVVYSANCMCHIQNIQEAFQAVHDVLSDDGIFIFEDPSMLEVIKNDSYDQFYDEHAHIFSIIALKKLLKECGLYIYHVEKLNTHGGSNRIYVSKHKREPSYQGTEYIQEELAYKLDKYDTYSWFMNRANDSKRELIDMIMFLKSIDKKIIGYGATSKSTTVYNFCGLNSSHIDCIVDTTPAKQGKLTPGSHIPIVAPTDEILNSADYAFLGAWNYRDEILKKERHRKLRFITHVPKVRIL